MKILLRRSLLFPLLVLAACAGPRVLEAPRSPAAEGNAQVETSPRVCLHDLTVQASDADGAVLEAWGYAAYPLLWKDREVEVEADGTAQRFRLEAPHRTRRHRRPIPVRLRAELPR